MNFNGKRTDQSPTRTKVVNYRDRSKEREHKNNNKHSNYKNTKNNDRSRDEDDIKELEKDTRGRKLQREVNKEDRESQDISDQDEMMRLMGFGSFDSTKNKHVEGVGKGSVKKNKKSQYRQYMNRDKGFNRALSPERKKL